MLFYCFIFPFQILSSMQISVVIIYNERNCHHPFHDKLHGKRYLNIMCLYYRYNANHCLPLHFQSTKKHFIFIHPAFQLVYILFNNHFGYISLLKGKYPTPKGQNQFSNKKKAHPKHNVLSNKRTNQNIQK